MTVESRVVGEAVVLQKWERGITEVELIHVPEVSRGQGYGKALMKEIEDFARTSGSATLRLNTVTFQGEGFYERCGMVEMGRVPLAALINGNRQYEITYWKDLSDSN